MSSKRQRSRYDIYVAILEALHTKGALIAGEIARSASLSFSQDTHYLTFLVEKGLVTKLPRVWVRYEITPSGRSFLLKMKDALSYLVEPEEKEES